jgi:hypothetical protein
LTYDKKFLYVSNYSTRYRNINNLVKLWYTIILVIKLEDMKLSEIFELPVIISQMFFEVIYDDW